MPTIDELFPEKKPKTIDELFPVKQEQGFLDASLETGRTIGQSMGASIAGGYSGIGSLMAGQGADAAANRATEVQGNLSNQPSERSQAQLQDIGSFFDTAASIAKAYPSMAAALMKKAFSEDNRPTFEIAKDYATGNIGEQLGSATFDATGSPLAATTAQVGAELIPDLLTGGIAKSGVKSSLDMAANSKLKKAGQAELDAVKQGFSPSTVTEEGIQKTVKAVQSATPEEIAKMIDADPSIMNAIDELGIDASPVYAQVSRNPQYREVEGGLRAIPGSGLNTQANEFISKVRQKADDLINTYGGTRDKANLSQEFEMNSLATIDDMRESANKLYGSIDDNIVKSEQAVPSRTLDYLNQEAVNLGGPNELPSPLKALYRKLAEKDVDGEIKNPTIGMIDLQRKLVGEAIGKKQNNFANQTDSTLKALYGRLTDDMNDILDSKGLKELSDEGKQLVKDRKLLESNIESLLGKNLQRDLMKVVSTSVKGLTNNNTKLFAETLNKIPTEYRQKAVVSALNDIFRGTGQGMESFNANSYLKFWNELSAQPAAKNMLMKELPNGLPKALEGMANIARGINQADRNVIRTGVIQAFFEPSSGLISKLAGNAGRLLATSKAGPAGSALYNTASDFLKQASSPTQMAAQLIAKPEFQKVVTKAINEGITNPAKASDSLKAAEKALMKSEAYKKWAATLSDNDKITANTGAIAFLLSVGQAQQEEKK